MSFPLIILALTLLMGSCSAPFLTVICGDWRPLHPYAPVWCGSQRHMVIKEIQFVEA